MYKTEAQYLALGYVLKSDAKAEFRTLDGNFLVYSEDNVRKAEAGKSNRFAGKLVLRTEREWNEIGWTVKPNSQPRETDPVSGEKLYSIYQCKGFLLDDRYSYYNWFNMFNRHVKKGEKATARDVNGTALFHLSQTAPCVPQGHFVTFNGHTLKFYS